MALSRVNKILTPHVLYRIPVVNVCYDVFFDEVPSIEQVQLLMTGFALLDALLITMAGAMMNCIDRDQAASIRKDVQDQIQERDITLLNGEVIDPYRKYLIYSCLSFDLFTSSLMVVFILYLGLGTLNFVNKYGKYSKSGYRAWWKWSRWVFASLFVLTAVGAAFLVMSTCYAWAMQHAETANQLAKLIWWSDAGNYLFLAFFGVVFPILVLSMGLIWRESSVLSYHDAVAFENESIETLVLYVGQQIGRPEVELRGIIQRMTVDHWLKVASDLIPLNDAAWKRLKLPLKLESALREELESEEIGRHASRKAGVVPLSSKDA